MTFYLMLIINDVLFHEIQSNRLVVMSTSFHFLHSFYFFGSFFNILETNLIRKIKNNFVKSSHDLGDTACFSTWNHI